MKELSKWQNAIFLGGGLLMVVGAGLSVLALSAAPYIYTVGALGFATMQMLQSYEGTSVTIHRLRNILILSDFLFVATAALMFASQDNLFGFSQITYVEYVYQKWVATLLLAAIIQLYAMHRIDHELKKEAKKR